MRPVIPRPVILRVVTSALEAGFDRPLSPTFAQSLYRAIQAFTALLSGILLTVLIMGERYTGLAFCMFGIVLTPFGWFITILTARMAIESALTVIALNEGVTGNPGPRRSDLSIRPEREIAAPHGSARREITGRVE